MVFTVNTDAVQLATMRVVKQTAARQRAIMGTIASGLKVDSAKDNAAVYTIAKNARSDISSINASLSSVNRAINVVDIALAGSQNILDRLNEMRERTIRLKDLGANHPNRDAVLNDLQEMLKSMNSVSDTAEFDGTNLLKGIEGTSSDGATTPTQKVDMVFLVDRTSSMGTTLDKMKDAAENLASELNGKADIQFGLAMYSDGVTTKISLGGSDFTTSATTLRAGMDSITWAGNVESSLDALIYASDNYSYRSGSNVRLVNLTDDTLQTAGSNTAADVVTKLNANGHTADLVGTGTADDHTIADSTGGHVFDHTNPDYGDIVDSIATDAIEEDSTYGDTMEVIISEGLDRMRIGHRPLTPESLNIGSLNFSDPDDAISHINKAIEKALLSVARLGADAKRLEHQRDFMTLRKETMEVGVGKLVDADLAKEHAKLQAEGVKLQLSQQGLSFANRSKTFVNRLFGL